MDQATKTELQQPLAPDPRPGPGMEAYRHTPPAPRRRNYSAWDPRSAPATHLLLAINVAVFLWMVLRGVSPSHPNPAALVHFGAQETMLIVYRGQWWRLLSATFVHIGLIHIASNMWCLWNLGLLGEPLIGPFGLVAVYMLTGIAGNLLSLGLNVILRNDSVGAGASGAVFGIAGLLIVLLSNRKLPIPWIELKRLRRSVIQFAILNLLIGGATLFLPLGINIDNSAHLGGFFAGLALGVPLLPRMTLGRVLYLRRQKATFAGAAFALALCGYFISVLR